MLPLPNDIERDGGVLNDEPVRISRRSTTRQAIAVQFLSLGLAMVQGFLLTPLYLKHIDYRLYGAWLATGQIAVWLSLLDPGVNDVLRQRVAFSFGGGSRKTLGTVLGSGLAMGFLIALLPTIAGLGVGVFVNHFIALDVAQGLLLRRCFQATVCATGLTIAAFAPGAALQGLQRNVVHGVVSLAGAIAYIGSAIYLLFAGWGLASIPAALFIRALIWFLGWTLAVVWVSRRHLGVSLGISWKEGKRTLGISTANGMSKLGSVLQTSTDAFLAGTMLGPEAAVMLTLTGRLSDFIRLVPDRIVMAFLPGLAHLAGEGDAGKFRRLSGRLVQIVIAFLVLFVGAAVVANQTFMRLWVGSKPYGGLALTLGLGASVMLMSSCYLLNSVLFSRGIIKGPAYASLGQACLKLLLALLLVRYLKLLAFPAAAIIAASATLAFYLIRKYRSATAHPVLGAGLRFHDWEKWFWAPVAGSMAIAAVIAVMVRPVTIQATLLAVAAYGILDGVYLLAISETLREEALRLIRLRAFTSWMIRPVVTE
jgi:O-antigen/teichoic acid export membrane protein